MKIVAIIARVLLGAAFVFFGLNGLHPFMKMPPPPPGLAGEFSHALFASGYGKVVALLQVIGGLLCLIGRFVPLGLTLLGPVIVNILLFHIFLNPSGAAPGVIVAVLALIVLWDERTAFAPLLRARKPSVPDGQVEQKAP